MKLFDENLKWFKGNMHAHTTISDGSRAPEEVIELYRAKDYDFLALTDHRKMSYAHTDGNMLLIGGVELDYMLADQCIHIVGIGLDRAPQLKDMRGANAQEGIDAINAAGGIAILAHPSWSLNTLSQTMPLTGLAAMEIYNSTSGTPWNAARADASQFVDLTYTHGKFTPVVASDDAHTYTGEHTRSFTCVNAAECTPEAIKSAIRAGRMFASQGPRFAQIEYSDGIIKVDCTPVKRVIFYSNMFWSGQRTFEGEALTHIEYPVKSGEKYVRVQLDDGEGNSAWSGAILM